jgi:hypothetical protein
MTLASYTLATLLHKADLTDYEVTADALETLYAGWTDERKADLYALLQDSVRPDMAFADLELMCAAALAANARRFGG